MSRKTEKKRRMSAGRVLDTGMTYLILLAVAFVFFFPCLWLILASFSKSGTIYSFDGFFPAGYSLASFKRLFTDTALYNYPRWFANTLFVAAGSCILGTFLVILTAYTMSRFTFAARKPMMKITMVLGMFPSFMGMIAVYLLMTQFNLINHLWGLILIYSAGAPMGYLTQKGFFDRKFMRGRRRKLLYILFSFLGWGALAICSFGIAALWISPYMTQTLLTFYLDGTGELDQIPVRDYDQEARRFTGSIF